MSNDLTIERLTLKGPKSKAAPDLKLDEDFAVLKGLPPVGYVPMWIHHWEELRVYRVTILGKKRSSGWGTCYTVRLDRLIYGEEPKKGVVLFRRDDEKDAENDFYAKRASETPSGDVVFTQAQFNRWYIDRKNAHLSSITQETFRLLPALVETQKQLDWLTSRRAFLLRDASLYEAMFKIKDPPKKRKQKKAHAP